MTMNRIRKLLMSVVLLFFVFQIISTTSVHAAFLSSPYPRRANYFLKWTLTDVDVKELSKWNLVVLDMEVQARQPEMLKKLREMNPNIILLAYITPQEIRTDASVSYSLMRRKLANNIPEGWYLHSTNGNRLSWWPETYLLNITNQAPLINGERFNTYLASFVATEIMGSGLWDGVFYDNAWDNITYFAKTSDIDLNGDRIVDPNVDHAWREGMKTLYRETRRLSPRPLILIGNGLTQIYKNELDGSMLENFHNFSWAEIMGAHKTSSAGTNRITIVNANTGNTGNERDYQRFRYGMASALLEGGFYSFDYGDTKHEQTWAYDEYATNLGQPVGSAASQKELTTYQPDVWRRDFEKGITLVNSTDAPQRIQLGGEYEAIHGTQDTHVNNGRIVSEVNVGAQDGQILLKTFEQIKDIVYTNGNFVRFLRANGARVRNGFFVFDSSYQGGDMIMRKDVNSDGEYDVIIISGNKLSVIRSDGQPYFSVFPYTANYTGDIRLAVGDLEGDGQAEIIVAPSNGFREPIKFFNLAGDRLGGDWFPFGTKYAGGYSIATGSLDADRPYRIVVGSGNEQEPTVAIFTNKLKKESSFFAFEKKFRGGLRLAFGDVNKDGTSEIVVAPASQKKPLIRIFDPKGKLLQKEFSAFTSFGAADVDLVQISDVDFDGVKDILVFTKNIGI